MRRSTMKMRYNDYPHKRKPYYCVSLHTLVPLLFSLLFMCRGETTAAMNTTQGNTDSGTNSHSINTTELPHGFGYRLPPGFDESPFNLRVENGLILPLPAKTILRLFDQQQESTLTPADYNSLITAKQKNDPLYLLTPIGYFGDNGGDRLTDTIYSVPRHAANMFNYSPIILRELKEQFDLSPAQYDTLKSRYTVPRLHFENISKEQLDRLIEYLANYASTNSAYPDTVFNDEAGMFHALWSGRYLAEADGTPIGTTLYQRDSEKSLFADKPDNAANLLTLLQFSEAPQLEHLDPGSDFDELVGTHKAIARLLKDVTVLRPEHLLASKTAAAEQTKSGLLVPKSMIVEELMPQIGGTIANDKSIHIPGLERKGDKVLISLSGVRSHAVGEPATLIPVGSDVPKRAHVRHVGVSHEQN